jgi:hypothetical protein
VNHQGYVPSYFDFLIIMLIYQKSNSNDRQSDDYIVVEEERRRRGRPSLRINIRNDGADAGKQEAPSPFVEETQRVTQSADSDERRRRQERNRSPTRIIITERCHEPIGSSHRQRLVQEIVTAEGTAELRQGRDRRTRLMSEEYEDPRCSRDTAEDLGNWQMPPGQEHNFGEREIDTTPTTKESSRRRRHGRTVEGSEFNWKGPSPHSYIRPQRDDEVLVVTERYAYRPRYLSHILEDRQRDDKSDSFQNAAHLSKQERIDEATIAARKHYRDFIDEAEAFSYFQDDWQRDESRHEYKPRQRVRSQNTANDLVTMYNAHKFDRGNLGDSTNSLTYVATNESNF